ncbi:hypothetical protein EMCRGX_G026191 [Ephydatia muelleri]
MRLRLVLLIAACCLKSTVASAPTVQTVYGKVQGEYTDTAQVFRSVPYAEPPIGALRWDDPRPPTPWQDVKLTTANPPGCPQSVPCGLPLSSFLCPPVIQEDCLYLNVFTPLDAMPGSNYPVMFFIHGGNFLRGYSGGQLYDGQYIANTTSTVVVTANYRLGAIGYLVYGDSLKGNYGLKDQRLALEWVRDNIANFGGNPYLVTYWGQSAGAISGAVHMTSIKSAGLFHRAILESEPFGITLKNIPDAQKLGNDFAMALGCNDITCLYSKNITEIAAAEDAVLSKIVDLFHALEIFLQWTPVVDGVEVLGQPFELFSAGEAAPLPVIIGTTSQESTFFIYEAFPKSLSDLTYHLLIAGVYGVGHYDAVLSRYPSNDEDDRPIASSLGFSFCEGQSCHGAELPYVFHTDISLLGFNYTSDELTMSSSMVQYWTNFAHYGNPNGVHDPTDLLQWPAFDGSSQAQTMRFKTPLSDVLIGYYGDTCNFWDGIGFNV